MARAPHLPPLKRVGHKGADLVAPGNTIESFKAALEHGVHMIEFDVLQMRDGSLVLAHDFHDAAGRETITLQEGLDHFAGEAYTGVELDVDLKLPGYEREVAEALLERELGDRSLISSTWEQSLELLGDAAPGVRRGWSVPRARRDYLKGFMRPATVAVAVYLRRRFPARAAEMVRSGRCEAIMAHWLLASSRLVDQVHNAGGHVYVWTVDDAVRIRLLDAMGVDGVITNDPRLFDTDTDQPAQLADLAGPA
ncbi:MAG: glycerophosphodiester phosphodiesterase [Thermoleophilaceae bacterium]